MKSRHTLSKCCNNKQCAHLIQRSTIFNRSDFYVVSSKIGFFLIEHLRRILCERDGSCRIQSGFVIFDVAANTIVLRRTYYIRMRAFKRSVGNIYGVCVEDSVGTPNVQNVTDFEFFPHRGVEIIHLATPPRFVPSMPSQGQCGRPKEA